MPRGLACLSHGRAVDGTSRDWGAERDWGSLAWASLHLGFAARQWSQQRVNPPQHHSFVKEEHRILERALRDAGSPEPRPAQQRANTPQPDPGTRW